MEFEKIIQLIKTVSDSNLTQFAMEEGNLKISMKTNKQTKVIAAPMMAPAPGPDMGPAAGGPVMQAVQAQAGPLQTEVSFQEAGEIVLSGNVVKSPLVGTFYNAPSPDAETFVKVGDTVKKGQVLGIVEAMKLMNEIESDVDGVIEEILVENAQGVEYGQPLFRIK